MKNTFVHFLFAGLLIVVLVAGCGKYKEDVEGEIVVAAASNFSEVFDEIGREYERRRGVRVINVYSATAELARQIENGAPYDIFASADDEHTENLIGEGLLVAETNRSFARGRLVLWIPAGSSAIIHDIEGLTTDKISRIAIARPPVAPYGAAAVEALKSVGLFESVEHKIVYAQSVAQAKQFAATGNADAAFVPFSLVREKGGRVIEVDEKLHRKLVHTIAVLDSTKKRDEADQFIDFLTSADGGASILQKYGYVTPER